jgi:hypothetical protein
MADIDAVTGMLTMPWWMAAVVAAGVVFLCVFAFMRNGAGRALAGLACFAVIAVAFGFGWHVVDRMAARDRADERRALDARLAELTLRMTSSPRACLGAGSGDVVDAACEKSLFATAETVAGAMAYADARLILLGDAADYAARGNEYEAALSALRRPMEADRFGFFAQVLSLRQNCTADSCEIAELLLQNPARIAANLRDNTYQGYVARHAANWGQPAGPGLAAVPVPAQVPAVTSSANFPGADAIPPVSIMNNEPGMPGQNGVDNTAAKPEPAKPAQQARRPAPRRAAEPAPAPAAAGTPGFPIPIAPPSRPAAANSGAATAQ